MIEKLMVSALGGGILVFILNYFIAFGSNKSQIKSNKKNINELDECKIDKEQVDYRLQELKEITTNISNQIEDVKNKTESNTKEISRIKGILSQMNGTLEKEYKNAKNRKDEREWRWF